MATSVIEQSFPICLPGNVADPADNLWEEIRWYLEDHARRDPFSFGRALTAERSLKSYGQSLSSVISEPDYMHKELRDSSLLIPIEYEGGYTHRVARMYWDILENVEIRPEQRLPSSVSIVRRTKPVIERHTLRSDWPAKGHSSGNNVLAITARPDRAHDIPHRLVTRSILDIVQEHTVGSNVRRLFKSFVLEHSTL
ncbi:MAG: hypothetical protein OHK93_004693 [Ramalina farinacea]|uniref:Uncharacterized protein n=1 Tax=Ramalina farinacea TaxID=258253 RepID=A0AA43QUN8_9LECA|nr:hypothetical protein [Ramalina farinacea]